MTGNIVLIENKLRCYQSDCLLATPGNPLQRRLDSVPSKEPPGPQAPLAAQDIWANKDRTEMMSLRCLQMREMFKRRCAISEQPEMMNGRRFYRQMITIREIKTTKLKFVHFLHAQGNCTPLRRKAFRRDISNWYFEHKPSSS